VAYLGIVLKRPSDARSRKYKVWGEFYKKIFSGNSNVEQYLLASLIYRKTAEYLISTYGLAKDSTKRYLSKNASFHISRVVAFRCLNGDTWSNPNLLKDLLKKIVRNDDSLKKEIDASLLLLTRIVKSNAIFSEDLNNALKSSELDNEINKKLYSLRKGQKILIE
jgi:hypothetical protein